VGARRWRGRRRLRRHRRDAGRLPPGGSRRGTRFHRRRHHRRAGARWLGLPAERRLLGHGVSTCATCDGFFYRNRPIAVVGGGDSALEEATFLTKFASKVTLVHRRDAFRARRRWARAFANPKIEVRYDTLVDDIIDGGTGLVTGIALRHAKTGAVETLPVDGVFIAIGHVPNTAFLAGQLELDEAGYVVAKERFTVTSVEGVFVAGDCQDHHYRQAITASAMGCMASLDAERWLAAR
jgi:thioredoxin reductase (NADPH)